MADLLLSNDLDILLSTTQLLFRPSQRISIQKSARSGLLAVHDRIAVLATTQIKQSLSFQFYKQGTSLKTDVPTTTTETPTSTFKLATQDGLVSIQIPNPVVMLNSSPKKKDKKHSSETELLNHLIKQYQVPKEHEFNLMHKLRVAIIAETGENLELLKTIRITSIAVYCNMLTEEVSNSKLFLYEPDLIQSFSDLIVYDGNESHNVHTAAICAIDSIARYKGKQNEVLGAVNASVAHGVVMYALHTIMNDISSDSPKIPQDYIDVLLGLVNNLSQ